MPIRGWGASTLPRGFQRGNQAGEVVSSSVSQRDCESLVAVLFYANITTMSFQIDIAVSGTLVLLAAVTAFAAEDLKVRIIDRQNHDRIYTYVVPGSSTSNSSTNLNCNGSVNNVNCSGTTETTATNVPGYRGSYRVTRDLLSSIAGWSRGVAWRSSTVKANFRLWEWGLRSALSPE